MKHRFTLDPARVRSAHTFGALIAMTALAAVVGCAGMTRWPGPPVVEIRLQHCRPDQDFHHVHRRASQGANAVQFVNQDGVTDTIEFRDWPFTGLPHRIFVHAGETSHRYPIDLFAHPSHPHQTFANQTAKPDTFEYKLWNGSAECGTPPQGPGVITDE